MYLTILWDCVRWSLVDLRTLPLVAAAVLFAIWTSWRGALAVRRNRDDMRDRWHMVTMTGGALVIAGVGMIVFGVITFVQTNAAPAPTPAELENGMIAVAGGTIAVLIAGAATLSGRRIESRLLASGAPRENPDTWNPAVAGGYAVPVLVGSLMAGSVVTLLLVVNALF